MLYRRPHHSPAAVLRAIASRVFGALAEVRRTDADTAYLDGLRPEQLKDLGIARIDARDTRYYR